MNRLGIRLTQATRATPASTPARKAAARTRTRKSIVRAMLSLLRLVEAHARRHRARLQQAWEQTDLSVRAAARIADRITHVLALLPTVHAQVETRLLDDARVPNADKLLSLTHPTSAVLVRGKTGQQVEYGHMLWLVEEREGVLIDWHLATAGTTDAALTVASLSRLQAHYGNAVRTLVTDRGCDSPDVRTALEAAGMRNAVASRSPHTYAVQGQDPLFRTLQRRRSQTEPRISILKHGTLRLAQRARSDPARALAVTWGVFTHNLWVLARLPVAMPLTHAA